MNDKLKKGKLYTSIVMMNVLIACGIIQMTSLKQIYILNFITGWVVDNTLNICIISALLVFVYKIEKKIWVEKCKDNME